MSPTPEQRYCKKPRLFTMAKQFLKDWDDLVVSNRYDLSLLKKLMILIIANDEPLPAEYSNHYLDKGKLAGNWDAHIRTDYVLLYKIDTSGLVAYFERVGSHAKLGLTR